jgi:hypothetical protein
VSPLNTNFMNEHDRIDCVTKVYLPHTVRADMTVDYRLDTLLLLM